MDSAKLNYLIAEKIMHDRIYWYHEQLQAVAKDETAVNLGRGIYVRCHGCDMHGYANDIDWSVRCPSPDVAPYGTNVDAAMDVATHVQAVYNVRFSLLVSEQATVVWARFFDAAADGQKQRRAVRSTTIPHAICMAALKFINSTFNNPPPKEHAR